MKNLAWLLFAVAISTGCNRFGEKHPHYTPAQRAAHLDSLKAELLQVDIAFSQLSEQKGRNAAFEAYADSDATMLRPYSAPLTGKDAIANMYSAHPDSGFVLTWLPIRSDVARSGDIGYTYGTYIVTSDTTDKAGGTYCTIWKRGRDHKWKYTLSTGNEGL